MKKLLLLLIIPLLIYSQEIVTNSSGKQIILKSDGTWVFADTTLNSQKKEVHKISNFPKYFNSISLENHNLYKFLNPNSFGEVKVFDTNNFDVIEVCCNPNDLYFLLKDKDENTAFVGAGSVHSYRERDSIINFVREKNTSDAVNAKRDINIIGTEIREINSAGGVSFSINWQYLNSTKEIKYIYFTVEPYNRVGDVVKCSISSDSEFKGMVTGPIEEWDQPYQHYWKNAWYNNTVHSIKISKVRVEYMDGTFYSYVNELNKISSPYLKYFSIK